MPFIHFDKISCPNCKKSLESNIQLNKGTFPRFAEVFKSNEIHSTGWTEFEIYPESCGNCELPINLVRNENHEVVSLEYPGDLLLAIQNRRKFLNWKIKQLNGWVSVTLLSRASCSIEGNLGALEYSDFIRGAIDKSEFILDIGCGNQELPIYFMHNTLREKVVIGLDPFPSEFSGTLIKGVAEFIPLADSSVDAVNCASTIDHFMNLDLALHEINRVLRAGGLFSIWDHSGQGNFSARFGYYRKIQRKFSILKSRKFRLYSNGIVFALTDKNDDPFHAYESRQDDWSRNLEKKLESFNFVKIDQQPEKGFGLWKKPD